MTPAVPRSMPSYMAVQEDGVALPQERNPISSPTRTVLPGRDYSPGKLYELPVEANWPPTPPKVYAAPSPRT